MNKRMKKNRRSSFNSQRGFTIVELITASLTLGVLAAVSIQNFSGIKDQALYSVVTQTMANANKATAAALADTELEFPDINYTQNTQGLLSDADAKAILPGFTLSQNVKIYLSYDSTCEDDSCSALAITVRHCGGKQFATYSVNGYGEEVLVDRMPGYGCP